MTTADKLTRIKALARKAIELDARAASGPWTNHDRCALRRDGNLVCVATPDHAAGAANVAFIAHARTFAPAAARALLTAIQGLEAVSHLFGLESNATLDGICHDWPEDAL